MSSFSRRAISAVVIGAATILAAPIITPAHATTFANTFYGTIASSDTLGDVTTNDTANLFGGGNLIGDAFTLTFTYTNISPGTTFFTGGTYYSIFAPNPVTATLTINGDSTTTGNSSDGSFGSTPTVYNLQAFTWSPAFGGRQTEGVVIDLAGLPSTDDFSTHFAPATTGFQDCTFSIGPCLEGSTFYTFSGETLVLNIQSINGPATPVPEPASLLVLGFGLIGLAAVPSRIRRLTG